MGAVILPGAQGRGRGLQILVPHGYEDVIVGKCLVPGCGATFYQGQEQQWQRHVGDCARENMDAIREKMHRLSIFDDFDPEVTAHLRKVGKRMLAERRMTVLPHETAGG